MWLSIGKIIIKIGSVDPEITPNNVTTITSLYNSIENVIEYFVLSNLLSDNK